jgi:hypothetical protein
MKRALVIALLLAAAPAQAEPENAVWLSIPSVDGAAGLEVGGEHRVAPRDTLALAASARRTASSDYDAVRLGAAVEYRRYRRGPTRSGWLYGARLDVTTSQLRMSDRPVGTLFGTGLRAELGYRLTPWRRLALTALVGVGGNVERDLDGRLPAQAHRVLGFGLDLGWMF